MLYASSFCQSGKHTTRYMSEAIFADSASSLMLPVLYNSELLSDNKLATFDEYYANIVFYNFKTDSSRRLFQKDTFIRSFTYYNTYSYPEKTQRKNDTMTDKWIFYFVKMTDYDKNGRVDGNDPSVLYVSDKQGDHLIPLTKSDENAISINIYHKQGFALVKMQRDFNHDRNFKNSDKDYYYFRIDLNSLQMGNNIEIDPIHSY